MNIINSKRPPLYPTNRFRENARRTSSMSTPIALVYHEYVLWTLRMLQRYILDNYDRSKVVHKKSHAPPSVSQRIQIDTALRRHMQTSDVSRSSVYARSVCCSQNENIGLSSTARYTISWRKDPAVLLVFAINVAKTAWGEEPRHGWLSRGPFLTRRPRPSINTLGICLRSFFFYTEQGDLACLGCRNPTQTFFKTARTTSSHQARWSINERKPNNQICTNISKREIRPSMKHRAGISRPTRHPSRGKPLGCLLLSHQVIPSCRQAKRLAIGNHTAEEWTHTSGISCKEYPTGIPCSNTR